MQKSRHQRPARLPPFELTRLSEAFRRKAAFVELYQAEWCPHSRKVRQKLTEVGLDFWARQVAAEPEDREQMRQHVGTDEIPVLVPEDGDPVCGEDDILEYLSQFEPAPEAGAHREKVASTQS
jgi:glutathione S-transferase